VDQCNVSDVSCHRARDIEFKLEEHDPINPHSISRQYSLDLPDTATPCSFTVFMRPAG